MRGLCWLTAPAIVLLMVPAACGTATTDVAAPASTRSVTSSATPTPSPTPPPTPMPEWLRPVSPTSIEFEPDDFFGGVPSRAVLDAADVISPVVVREPERYTRVAVTAESVVVTLPDGPDLAGREAALDRLTEVPITFAIAVRSRAEQDRLQVELTRLMGSGPYAGEIISVGTDSRGAVEIGLNRDRDTVATRTALKQRYGVAVVFREMGGAVDAYALR